MTQTEQNQKSVMLGISDVQREYLPMLSLKRIRHLVVSNCRTIRVGNRILVERANIENLLCNPSIGEIR